MLFDNTDFKFSGFFCVFKVVKLRFVMLVFLESRHTNRVGPKCRGRESSKPNSQKTTVNDSGWSFQPAVVQTSLMPPLKEGEQHNEKCGASAKILVYLYSSNLPS